jgi:proline dehydrogenase
MGLDVSRDSAVANAARVVARASQTGSTVTFDMEDHRYTERTVEICLDLAARHPDAVGLALQSYLFRTPSDLERVLHVPVRICKGAYLEPRGVAYRRKSDVDRAFAHQVRRLLEAGAYPMIATHDERLVRFARKIAQRSGRSPQTFEFQMLYGVRRDLQDQLAADGYRVRVYVPFGTEWYPYLVRRLAERPANLLFFLSQVVRG